jgi:hypothetical protein
MYSQVVRDGHPMVLLIKNTRLTEKQRELLNEIVEIENWTEGIVYNGDGLVIQSKYLRELKKIAKTLTKPFKVKYGVNIGERIVTGPRETRHDALEKGGKRCLYIKDNISVGMQCFRELIKSGVRITHLVIIADRMADRGISFVSSDYKLRLTCQYYVPSSTATMSHKLQAIRLCGVYNDNLPSMLFAPPDVCEDLVKANLGQEELIGRLKESESDEGTMTVCSGFKYSKSKLPKSKWGAAKMPCQIVDKSDGGVSRKEYNSALEDIKQAEGVEHLVKEEEDEEEEKHNGYQSDPDWLPNKCIFRILQENICSGIYKKVLDATIIVLKNIGKGKWHTRTDVVSKLLESKIEGWDVCYGDKFRARLSDFCTKKQFHQIITDDDSKGLLFKQIGSRWQLRLN